ncbi:MAG: hypothetical protein HZA17_11545 [Nitrospirae bacterium]|nr:hypothetical protein [Nitrospirota bacterium]
MIKTISEHRPKTRKILAEEIERASKMLERKMNDQSTPTTGVPIIQPCLLHGELDLPGDTPIYRYLTIEAFLFLWHFKSLTFSRLVSWPDAYEGVRYEMFKAFKKDPHFSEITRNDFLGSCWSLQTEDNRLYENKKEQALAIADLKENGSAAMWDIYCKKGGVRIKTSISKVDRLLTDNWPTFRTFRGKVYYEPATDYQKTIKTTGLISTLFMKRVAFRHEAEYRYILIPGNPQKSNVLTASTGDLLEFLDEVLICPAIGSSKWISQTLHSMVAEHAEAYRCKKVFSRISQLYEPISEGIGKPWHE